MRRDRALLLLYRGLAACALAFFLMFLLLSPPAPGVGDASAARGIHSDPGAEQSGSAAKRVDTQRRLLDEAVHHWNAARAGTGSPPGAPRTDATHDSGHHFGPAPVSGPGAVPGSSRRLQQAALGRLRGAAAAQGDLNGTGSSSHGVGDIPGGRAATRALHGAGRSARRGDRTLSAAQRAVRAAYYLWLGTANLVRGRAVPAQSQSLDDAAA